MEDGKKKTREFAIGGLKQTVAVGLAQNIKVAISAFTTRYWIQNGIGAKSRGFSRDAGGISGTCARDIG